MREVKVRECGGEGVMVAVGVEVAECPFCGRQPVVAAQVVFKGSDVERSSYGAFCESIEGDEDEHGPACPVILEMVENDRDVFQAVERWNDAMAMLDRKGV